MPDDFAKLQSSPPAMAAWQNAQQNLRDRRFAAAAAIYRDLTQQFPEAAQLWIEFSAATAGELDFDLASEATARAAKLAVANPSLFASVGRQYCQINRPDLANDCFTRAVAAEPSSAGPRLTLASWLERNGRLDEARECIDACLKQHPGNGRAQYLKAFLLHRQGLNEKAAVALHDLLKNGSALPLEGQAQARHLLGLVFDALGQYAEALQSLQESKALQRQLADAPALEQTYDALDQSRRELLAQLTAQTLNRWRDDAEQTPALHPLAFLGGAPRSGTTLVEQILGAHPEIMVFDEPPAFAREMLDTILPLAGNSLTFDFLDRLAPADRSRSVDRYFKSLLFGNRERLDQKLLLDKNPSTTGSLHVWLRLFSRSKIIIALRDPRDVIISCYFQNGRQNYMPPA
jgi:tetratricopeptide (TPR) repeat protein